MKLEKSRLAWGREDFPKIFCEELMRNAAALPLQQGLSASSIALESGIEIMFIGASERDGALEAKAGIFYQGLVAGCSCADDPTPVEPAPEYCEVRIAIDAEGNARAALWEDGDGQH